MCPRARPTVSEGPTHGRCHIVPWTRNVWPCRLPSDRFFLEACGAASCRCWSWSGATATTLLPVPVAFFAAAVAMVLFRVIPGARGLCGHRWTDPGGARSPHPSQRFPQNHRRHGRHRGMACEVRFCPAAGRRIPSSVLQSKRAGNKHIYQCDISVADSSLFFSVAFGPLRRLRVLALSFAGCLVGVGQARTLAFHNFIGDGLEATGSLVIPSPFALLTRSVVGVHERQRSDDGCYSQNNREHS